VARQIPDIPPDTKDPEELVRAVNDRLRRIEPQTLTIVRNYSEASTPDTSGTIAHA